MNDHVVYRLIGPADALLYIGCTSDLTERLRRHRIRYGAELVSHQVDSYPTRDLALAAERAGIVAEQPAYNIQHASRPTSAPGRFDARGRALAARAGQRGYSIPDLAAAAGAPVQALTRFLMDTDRMPLPLLARVARVLGTTASVLVSEWEAAA